MKWKRKYDIDTNEIHQRNLNGESLVDIGKSLGVNNSTLRNYMQQDGYDIVVNRKNDAKWIAKRMDNTKTVYVCLKAWKNRLIREYGHRCMVCDYERIVEAHHVIPRCDGGQTSVENGILLCPTHHAEAHAGILETSLALVKRDELLGSPVVQDNQQPSLEGIQSDLKRVQEGSTTSSRAEAVMEPRASRSRRWTKEEYFLHVPTCAI